MSKDSPAPPWPHVDAGLLELDRATRAFQRAVDEMDTAAVDYLGINRSDGNCLDVLQERGPLSAGELAVATGLSPGAITTLVDRLEKDGYVRRTRAAFSAFSLVPSSRKSISSVRCSSVSRESHS